MILGQKKNTAALLPTHFHPCAHAIASNIRSINVGIQAAERLSMQWRLILRALG